MAWDEWEPDAFPEQWPRDHAIDAAREAIEAFFNENRTKVCYLTQLKVMFEKRFFHWITGKAITELVTEGRLRNTFAVSATKTFRARIPRAFRISPELPLNRQTDQAEDKVNSRIQR